jgi:hypothetical protein
MAAFRPVERPRTRAIGGEFRGLSHIAGDNLAALHRRCYRLGCGLRPCTFCPLIQSAMERKAKAALPAGSRGFGPIAPGRWTQVASGRGDCSVLRAPAASAARAYETGAVLAAPGPPGRR